MRLTSALRLPGAHRRPGGGRWARGGGSHRKDYCVRRLPVEGFGGTVMGIVSMNDIVLASGPRKKVRDTEVVNTLQAICAHHHPSPHVVAA